MGDREEDVEKEKKKKDPFVIEFGRKLSESALWKANAHYYKSMGTMAFQFLPSYATMNCFLARSYANLVLSYLRECLLVCPLSFPLEAGNETVTYVVCFGSCLCCVE